IGCPELVDFTPKPGFEWVANELRNMLDKQAIAHNYGLVEATLYSGSSKKRERQNAKRSDLTFDGLLRLAKSKVGRPAELMRDIDRAILVRTYQKKMGLKKTEALGYVAGMEVVSKSTVESRGK